MFTVAHAVDVSRVRVGWAAQWWLIGLFYGVSIFLLWGSLEEDSYIFFRVADNLAHGAGYVFNRGGERVETGSSPVWQGLLTLGSGLSVSLYGWAKGLGAAAAALALWQARALERVFLPRSSLMLAPWLLVTSITFLFWSQSGMETGLFAALVLTWARCLLDPAWPDTLAGWVCCCMCAVRKGFFIGLLGR